MPTIPVYDGPQVSQQALQGGYQQAPSQAQSGTAAIGAGLTQVGDVADRIDQSIQSEAAFKAATDVKTQWMQTDAALRQKYQGANAGQYVQEANAFWAKAQSTLKDTLTPRAQAMVAQSLGVAKEQALGAASQYFVKETARAQDESYAASQLAEIGRAAASGDPAVASVSQEILKRANAQQAVIKGWTPEVLTQQNMQDTTKLHVAIIDKMMQTDPTAALAYFQANKADIAGTQQGPLQHALTEASAAVEGLTAAHTAFSAHLPDGATPESGTQPLDIVAMRTDIESKFKNDPIRMKAADDALNHLVTDWKTSEAQFQTGYKATLEAGVAQGKGLAWVQSQPEWRQLDGTTQAAISDHLIQKAYTAELRAQMSDVRAEREQMRQDRLRGMSGFQDFVDLQMNPDKLAAMQPQDVKNLALTMSQPQVEHLMEQRAKLNSAADIKGAVMDAQTFDAQAESFGVKSPIDPTATKDDKAVYSTLKTNIDYALTQAQQAKKSPLTQPEKVEIMRNEMANQVTINPGWFSSNQQVPVVQLRGEQGSQVVVPEDLSARISASLKQKGLPVTPENIRATYLRMKSPAGAIINVKQQ